MDGFHVFYREAGAPEAQKLLLLHGFPTASHMFRGLIPLFADRFHIVAPDLPGFGKSDMPARGCTFDRIAGIIDQFTEIVGFDRYAVYIFDYGAPTGLRLAVKHPERITAIVSQNGNAYDEGLSQAWIPNPSLLGERLGGKSPSFTKPTRAGSGANGGRRAYLHDTKSDIGRVSTMLSVNDLFKGRHFDREIITLCVALLHGGELGRNSPFGAVIMRGARTVPDRAHAYD